MREKFSTEKNDEYYTPEYGVRIIEPYLKEEWKTIWCPFDKEWSKYVKIFKELGYNVIYTHIDEGQDFLTYKPDFDFDVIISNPPFSIKNEVIKKCREYNKPYCLLLPYSMFFAKSSIQNVGDNIQFLMIDDRISFNGERANFNSWYIGGNKFFEKDINVYLFKESPVKLWHLENK
jgi:hypothetical protein